MEEAKTLIRTAVRTFFHQPRQILIVDALMLHSVLGMDDLSVLLSAQPKDIRSLMTPLRNARLVQTHSRVEVRVGSQRGSPREYYYCPFHPAIDAIKYRIAKLRKKVEALYQQDETKRKDWRCPRCKAEYDELAILDKVGADGFYCDRCGSTLVQNERAAAEDRGHHEKIRRVNDQLKRFDDMILKIDRKDVPENDFQSAWERKKDVPRERGGKEQGQYVEIKRGDARNLKKGPEMVKVENLAINLTSGAEHDREEAERKEERKRLLAKQNQLPAWHTSSAIGPAPSSNGAAVKVESGTGTPESGTADMVLPKKEEDDEDDKKNLNIITDGAAATTTAAANSTLQDEVAAYMAEMERERLEAEKRAKEEDEEDDGDEDDDDDLEFEDVDVVGGVGGSGSGSGSGLGGGSIVGTPAGTGVDNPRPVNGVKREFDDESGPSSDANTPVSFGGGGGAAAGDGGRGDHNKRVKFENGMASAAAAAAAAAVKVEGGGVGVDGNGDGNADSDEDEDFEDAM
ncbi:hypothetical protein PV08_06284 [Exophiala spinifera]|uniref:HTH TFE/IIEalpha-type domain-containing protein n=1 Tax=Exophiala spinifera TaxID=91928 RepID=A0A0D2BB46_9EURO|nr:uncharacterized protein PV08_06284 [Exophiala spinifera]KIW16233.1 hypothetical protein PV08_06284 [Exophiala spinifera]